MSNENASAYLELRFGAPSPLVPTATGSGNSNFGGAILWIPLEWYDPTADVWASTAFGTFVDGGGGGTYNVNNQAFPVSSPVTPFSNVSITTDTPAKVVSQPNFESYALVDLPGDIAGTVGGAVFDAGGRLWVLTYPAMGDGNNLSYSDDLASFTLSTSLLDAGDFLMIHVAAHPTDQNRIAAIAGDITGPVRCYTTIDRGANWTRTTEFAADDVADDALAIWLPSGRLLVAWADETANPQMIHSNASDDDGATWNGAVTVGNRGTTPAKYLADICADADGVYIAADTGSGVDVYRSFDDGDTWDTKTLVGDNATCTGLRILGGALYGLTSATDLSFSKVTDPTAAFTISTLAAPTHGVAGASSYPRTLSTGKKT